MTDTPRTNEALAALLDRDGELSEENAPEVLVKLCKAMERERDEALKWSAMLADAGDEIRAQLREEQRLHVQTLNERDEARQWESQALVARIQRDEFSKTLGEVREILCEALPNENQLTSSMAVKLAMERDEAREQRDKLAKAIQKHKAAFPFAPDFCDVELYEALAAWKEARSESALP